MSGHIAIVGGGLVGSGWAIVFARAGESVRIYDADANIRNGVMDVIRGQLEDLKDNRLVDDVIAILDCIQVCSTLQYAIGGAIYIQESVFEQTDVKTEISAAIAPLLSDGAVVGSSTSGIPASDFTENLTNRNRFLVAHPVNPPYLAPIVEIVPTPWTDESAVESAMALMRTVGQSRYWCSVKSKAFYLIACKAPCCARPGRYSKGDTPAPKTSTKPYRKDWACVGPSWVRSKQLTSTRPAASRITPNG